MLASSHTMCAHRDRISHARISWRAAPVCSLATSGSWPGAAHARPKVQPRTLSSRAQRAAVWQLNITLT